MMAVFKAKEEAVIRSLENADLEKLSRQATELKVIPQKVKKSFDSLDSSVPPSRKLRYLLVHSYKQLEGNSRLCERWLKLLQEHGPVSSILSSREASQASNDGEKRTQRFSKEHVPILVERLASHASKWNHIATSFNLPAHIIDELLPRSMYDPKACLHKVILEWIVGKHPHAKAPTVENLLKTLRSNLVGLGIVAYEIETEPGCFNWDLVAPSPKKPCLEPQLEIIVQSYDTSVDEEKGTLLEVELAALPETSVSFQWLKDGCPLQEEDSFLGVDKPILCLNSATLALEGVYECLVETSNPVSTVRSAKIALNVNSPIKAFKKVLVDRYSAQPEVPEDSWPPVSNNTYINLALIKQGGINKAGKYARNTIQGNVDDIIADKERIEYADAFSGLESGTRLLVEGRPGSGKTTLVHKFSRDWAVNAVKNSVLLFLVHLRGFFNNSNVELRDIVQKYYTNDTTVETIVQHAEKNGGEGLCFVLDGLDEYSPSNKNETFIFRLIKKQVLPKSIVIVASRPAASARLRKVATKQIEVIGFLKEQIFEYVEKFKFSVCNKIPGLHQYLELHPNVQHMCFLPIHAAMVCYLYDIMENELPRTETEMYTEFTRHTLLRTISRERNSTGPFLESLDDLLAEEKILFLGICKLAFEKTLSSKQVMIKSEVKGFFKDISSGNESMGLITVDSMARKCGFENLYTFLHLTFQEYLAAYHLSKLEETQLTQVLQEYGEEKHMQVVWKFCCGLAGLNHGNVLVNLMQWTQSKDDDSLFSAQCAFESQCSSACDFVAQSGTLSFVDHFLTLLDFTAIGYVLSTSRHSVAKLVFDKCNMTTEGIEVLVQEAADKLSSVTTVCFHGKTCTIEQLLVFKSLLEVLVDLEKLNISRINFGPQKIKLFTENLILPNLHTVVISISESDKLDADCIKSLTFNNPKFQQVVCCNDTTQFFHFKHIIHAAFGNTPLCIRSISTCTKVKISPDFIGCMKVAEYVSDGLKQWSWCTSLDLTKCKIGDEGCASLASGLAACHKTMKNLVLSYNEIGDSGIISLNEALKNCISIEIMDFAMNHIHNAGVSALAKSIEYFSQLKDIDISYNHFDDGGASSLARSFQGLSYLEHVYLKCNSIGDSGAIAITRAVKNCSNLKLKVWSLSISRDGADEIKRLKADIEDNFQVLRFDGDSDILPYLLTEQTNNIEVLEVKKSDHKDLSCIIQYCRNLKTLKFYDLDLSSKYHKSLLNSLIRCNKLQVLDLSQAFKRSVVPFTDDLTNIVAHCPHLETLDISGRRVGSQGLASVLKNCNSLQTLNLECNFISDVGVPVLVECLKHLPNLCVLNLDYNDIRDACNILADGLKQCDHLTDISLQNNYITDDGAIVLAGLGQCKNLCRLKLGYNCIGPLGAAAIVRYSDQQYLHLQSNRISFVDKNLSNALLHCYNSLKSLTLRNNHAMCAEFDSAKFLADGLRYCENLQLLDLSHTEMKAEGAKTILAALTCCSNLHILYLDKCCIIADDLVGFLTCSTRLQKLSLNSNGIGDRGVVTLARALQSCHKMKTLLLARNNIDDDGVSALAESLKNCQHLRTIDLSYNNYRINDKHMISTFQKWKQDRTQLQIITESVIY